MTSAPSPERDLDQIPRDPRPDVDRLDGVGSAGELDVVGDLAFDRQADRDHCRLRRRDLGRGSGAAADCTRRDQAQAQEWSRESAAHALVSPSLGLSGVVIRPRRTRIVDKFVRFAGSGQPSRGTRTTTTKLEVAGSPEGLPPEATRPPTDLPDLAPKSLPSSIRVKWSIPATNYRYQRERPT